MTIQCSFTLRCGKVVYAAEWQEPFHSYRHARGSWSVMETIGTSAEEDIQVFWQQVKNTITETSKEELGYTNRERDCKIQRFRRDKIGIMTLSKEFNRSVWMSQKIWFQAWMEREVGGGGKEKGDWFDVILDDSKKMNVDMHAATHMAHDRRKWRKSVKKLPMRAETSPRQ